MKELVFIFIISFFNLSYEEIKNLPYSYDETNRLVEVDVSSCTDFFYIWIDQKEGALRIHKEGEDKNVWNDIRVRKKDEKTTKFHYEIGIYVKNVSKLYFNFSREFKEKDDVDYSNLNKTEIENYYGFKNMKCNDSNYYEYIESRDNETKYRPGYHHTPFIGWMNS